MGLEEETSSKEDENYQLRMKEAKRDKPKGRRSKGEMHSTPEDQSMAGGRDWKSGDNLVVLRFQSVGV